MSGAVEQLRAAVDRLLREGRAEGIEPDGPLGQWLEAQAGTLSGFAAIVEGQAAKFDEVLARMDAASQVELRKLATALELAREASKQSELAVAQARNAHLLSVVERENLVQRMIQDTLPMFADRLKAVLVIREARWNRDRARRRYALAGLVFLGVFCGGYGLSTWSASDRLAAFDRCGAAPLVANGHTYCALDAAVASQASPADGSRARVQ